MKSESFSWVLVSEVEGLRAAVKTAHAEGFRECVRVEVAKLEKLRAEAHAAGFSEGAAAESGRTKALGDRCAALALERDSWRERYGVSDLECADVRDKLEGERAMVASLEGDLSELRTRFEGVSAARCQSCYDAGIADGRARRPCAETGCVSIPSHLAGCEAGRAEGRGERAGVWVAPAAFEALRADVAAIPGRLAAEFQRGRDAMYYECAPLRAELDRLRPWVDSAAARDAEAFERGRVRAYDEFSPLTERCERAEAEATALRARLSSEVKANNALSDMVANRDATIAHQAAVNASLVADNDAFRERIRAAEAACESAEARVQCIRATMDREAADSLAAQNEAAELRASVEAFKRERADAEAFGNACYDEGFTEGRKVGSREAAFDATQYLRALACAADLVSIPALVADVPNVCETMRKGRSGE